MSRFTTKLCTAAVTGAIAMSEVSGALAAPGALEGAWAGEQFRLVIDASGGRFEASCADGTLSTLSALSADGRFTAVGTFQRQSAGSAPQRVETAGPRATPAAARFSGEVDKERMTLSIWPEGAAEAQVFHLQRGAKIKLIRCL